MSRTMPRRRCLLGAVAATAVCLNAGGCATSPVVRWSVPAHAACRCESHNPVLTDVTLTTVTHDRGRKATTGIWVRVVNRTWTDTLVRATNLGAAHPGKPGTDPADAYLPGSTHTMELPFERSRYHYGFFATAQDPHYLLDKIPATDQRAWHRSDCDHLRFQIGIMARGRMLGTTGNTFGFDGYEIHSGYGGRDIWSFDAILTLHFSDGSELIYERPNIVLDSEDGRLDLTHAR